MQTRHRATTAIRVGAQGRIVLPTSIRKAMRLEVGSALVIHVDRDRIVLESPDKVIDELQNYFGDVSRKVSLAKELIHERRLEAKKENKRQWSKKQK